jgi:hypothetical protein
MSNETMLPQFPVETTKAPVAKYRYLIPKSSRMKDADPSSVTLIELTLAQDLGAATALETDPFAKIKMAIFAVNDKPLDWVSGGADRFFESVSAKVREHLVQAFIDVNQTSATEKESFLASKTVIL